MKINILHDHIDPAMGGIENTSFYLLSELHKTMEAEGFAMTRENGYVLPNVCYSACQGARFKKERMRWLSGRCRQDSEAVNIAMNWYSAMPCLLNRLMYGNEYIVLAHGNEVYFPKETIKGIAQKIQYLKRRLATKIFFDHALCVCCNSKYTEGLVRQITGKCHTRIIHPGIHFKETGEVCADPNMILSIGRLVERKGFQFVIRALPGLLRDHPKLKYYIIGDGPYRSDIEKETAAYGLTDHVVLLGAVSEKMKNDYLEKCAFLIMPSLDLPSQNSVEGFGIVYIEANMYGKYVIGSDSGGIRDAIAKPVYGALLEQVTAASTEQAIQKVLDHYDDLYTKDKIAMRKEWARQHGFAEIARQYLTVIQDNRESQGEKNDCHRFNLFRHRRNSK